MMQLKGNTMEELLQRLELKIKELADQHARLKHSNQQLQQGKITLTREKELLRSTQEKTIVQIESLISRLKTIEKLP